MTAAERLRERLEGWRAKTPGELGITAITPQVIATTELALAIQELGSRDLLPLVDTLDEETAEAVWHRLNPRFR
ncbi:MAG: hypothetical protein ACYTBJ_01840 [Planctomycetota bacterium]|jgi:hypothetical protein